jgi:hypothetical protein
MTFDPKVTWVAQGDDDDDPDPRVADIQLRPGFSAHVWYEGDGKSFIEIDGAETVPNACYVEPTPFIAEDDRYWYERNKKFTSGITLNCPEVKNERQLAIALLTARIVSEVHEEFEFTKLGGQRLAEPHPTEAGYDMWDWLYRRVNRLVRDYIREFPVEES